VPLMRAPLASIEKLLGKVDVVGGLFQGAVARVIAFMCSTDFRSLCRTKRSSSRMITRTPCRWYAEAVSSATASGLRTRSTKSPRGFFVRTGLYQKRCQTTDPHRPIDKAKK